MSERTPITEKQKVHEAWYETAHDMNLGALPEFMRHLTEDYQHDYGTICHAVAAAAIAAAWAVERSPNGGITGFQAGAIAWEFWTHWLGEKSPLRMVNYNDFLYPQYADKHDKTISLDTWQWLQQEAERLLTSADMALADKRVVAHWRSIVNGTVPFGYRVEVER